jgi:hypothetical protein
LYRLVPYLPLGAIFPAAGFLLTRFVDTLPTKPPAYLFGLGLSALFGPVEDNAV